MIEPTHFESLYPDTTRFDEIEKILSYIKEGSSCQVIGLPGGGRSNLLGLLSYNRNVRLKHLGENQKWFHFVLSNFAEVRKRSLLDTTKFLFLSLIASLRERGMQEEHQKTSAIFKKSLSFNDELVLFQGLKRTIDLLSIEKELTVVFLFDRFEDYIPTATPEFFTNLRMLRDRAKYRFSVVFSLHKPLEDLIGQDLLLDFYQFVAGHTIYLSLFDKPGLDFRISYMEKVSGKTLTKKLIDDILGQTAGHPNLTRLSVEAVLETTNVIPAKAGILDFSKDNVWIPDQSLPRTRYGVGNDKSLSQFFLSQKTIKAALFDIWKCLTPAEQKFLTTVIPSPAQRGEESPEVFVQRRGSSRRFAPQDDKIYSQDDNQSSYLENVGLVKNGKITIPLFSQFVKQFTKASSHIPFDPNTLSDSLTSSEFKLLTYLMQNNNRIIEREEVINKVWADTKSTAGVTDQALDQLIFRLRKKIEDDPNNPAHLQTVKGRGFRFSP